MDTSKVTMGKNEVIRALNLAIIRNDTKQIESLFIQIITLPPSEQTDYLRNLPRPGVIESSTSYPNPLFYAADLNDPVLFNKLIAEVIAHPNAAIRKSILDTKNERELTPLMLAAQLGANESIKKLLEEKNANAEDKSKAFIWANYKGNLASVMLLLDDATLQSKGKQGDSALNFAVASGNIKLVTFLLEKDIDVTIRNKEGSNVFELAARNYPQMIKPLLMHLVTLPLDKQAECLRNLPDGPYPNALFYAAKLGDPSLFDDLVIKVFEQPDAVRTAILETRSEKENFTPLILAAQIKASSFNQLLALQCGLNLLDRQAALYWAAYYGNLDTVKLLLNDDAILQSRGPKGDTCLHYAATNHMLGQSRKIILEEENNEIMRGKGAVIAFLLEKNIDVNVRNNSGMNALDLAIRGDSILLEPLLNHLKTLPYEDQAECLLNIPEEPFNEIYFNVLLEEPKLFEEFLSKINSINKQVVSNEIISFDNALLRIQENYQSLKSEAQQDNQRDIAAAAAARTLLKECIKAKVALFKKLPSDTIAFTNSCQEAIKKAEPDLSQHPKFKNPLTNLMQVLRKLLVLPLSKAGFFSLKPASVSESIDNLKESVKTFNKSPRHNH